MKVCLIESDQHPQLSQLTQGTRIRYKCVDVCEHFIGFGTSAGDVLVFKRSDQRLLKRIPCAIGRITKICFNPENDNIMCIASNRGIITLLEHNSLTQRSTYLHKVLYTCGMHSSNSITDLIWSDTGTHFIAGDDTGLVSITDIYAINDAVIFDMSPSVTIQLDTAITQLDVFKDRLLLSTMTATYLCDVNDKKYARIGKKPRKGQYGGCFGSTHLTGVGRHYPYVFVCRPGGRIWKVDEYGNVECTLNFKNDSSTTINHPLFHSNGLIVNSPDFEHKIQFGLIYPLDEYLVTYNDDMLLILQIDDERSDPRVIWQTTHFAGTIADLKIEGKTIFILDQKGKFTEWRFITDVFNGFIYKVSNIFIRCAIVISSLMTKDFLEAFEKFKKDEILGKEVIFRDYSKWKLSSRARPYTFQLSALSLLRILSFFEFDILLKETILSCPFVLYIPNDNDVEPAEIEEAQIPEKSDIDKAIEQIESFENLQIQEQSEVRRLHKKFLISLIDKLQNKVADSLLVDVVGSFWTQKPPLEVPTGHYLDSPITEWGVRTNLNSRCDVCQLPLIIESVDNDLQFHYCGHKMHASCNFMQNLCFVCS